MTPEQQQQQQHAILCAEVAVFGVSIDTLVLWFDYRGSFSAVESFLDSHPTDKYTPTIREFARAYFANTNTK